jgi:hypothetical protein
MSSYWQGLDNHKGNHHSEMAARKTSWERLVYEKSISYDARSGANEQPEGSCTKAQGRSRTCSPRSGVTEGQVDVKLLATFISFSRFCA